MSSVNGNDILQDLLFEVVTGPTSFDRSVLMDFSKNVLSSLPVAVAGVPTVLFLQPRDCFESSLAALPAPYFALSPASIGTKNGERGKGYRNYRRGQAAGALADTPDGYAARCGVLTAEPTSVLAGAHKLAATVPDTRRRLQGAGVVE